MNDVVAPIVTIAMGIVGLAFLSVLVSKNANTSGVLGAFGNMFSNMLSAATGPVTGNTATPQVGSVGSSTLGGLGSFNMPGLPNFAN